MKSSMASSELNDSFLIYVVEVDSLFLLIRAAKFHKADEDLLIVNIF